MRAYYRPSNICAEGPYFLALRSIADGHGIWEGVGRQAWPSESQEMAGDDTEPKFSTRQGRTTGAPFDRLRVSSFEIPHVDFEHVLLKGRLQRAVGYDIFRRHVSSFRER